MRIMAIDYGDAHTGVAISDAGETLAGFTTVIDSWHSAVVAEKIAALCVEHGVEALVLVRRNVEWPPYTELQTGTATVRYDVFV